jgi:hypothetical protein
VTWLARLATISSVWRRLHVLNPVQGLVLASVSAAIIALPLALQSVPRNDTALLRNFFWPDILNPYITFSFVFLGIVPALLGYYNLGRLGFLLSVSLGFAFAWIMAVCGLLCLMCRASFRKRMARHRCLRHVRSVGVCAHCKAAFKGGKVPVRE